jgi:trans-aconitate methyltransferase
MHHRLYDDLIDWYPLIDPRQGHRAEAAAFAAAFATAVQGRCETLLELGAGAGNNATWLRSSLRCTLTDRSDRMLDLSRAANPDCEHLPGDMRTLRLDRQFDAVLVHDAVQYLLDEAALAEAITTAFVHTRPGGAAIFAPDCVRETFFEATDAGGGVDATGRTAQFLEWRWDPDPSDTTYRVEYALLLRDGDQVTAVHDTHVEGLFSRKTWRRLLESAGFTCELIDRPLEGGGSDRIFLARRPR